METEVAVTTNSIPGDGGVGAGAGPQEVQTTASSHQSEVAVSKLSIRGAGLAFDRDVPESVALRIMQLVMTGDAGSGAVGAPMDRSESVPANGRKESLAEFYRRTSPTQYSEKLTTIGAYLETVVGRESFTLEELRAQFRSVGEPQPANPSRDFNKAIAEGWIAPDSDQPGRFFVTRLGSEAVKNGFEATMRGRVSAPRRRKRSVKPAVESASDSNE